jgi:hypothetical protein
MGDLGGIARALVEIRRFALHVRRREGIDGRIEIGVRLLLVRGRQEKMRKAFNPHHIQRRTLGYEH